MSDLPVLSDINIAALTALSEADLLMRIGVLRQAIAECVGDPRLQRTNGALQQKQALEMALERKRRLGTGQAPRPVELRAQQKPPAVVIGMKTATVHSKTN